MPTRRDPYILFAALLLGVVGDGLLRAEPWGINLPLWMLLAAIAAQLAPEAGSAARRDAQPLIWAAVIPAAGLGWRAAEVLALGNVMATAALLLLALIRARGMRLDAIPLGRLAAAGIGSAAGVAAGAIPILGAWRPRPSAAGGARWRAVAVGLVLALPVSAVFTALLAAADPVFERAVRLVFSWDMEKILSHTLLTGFVAWIALGYLLGLRPRQADQPGPAAGQRVRPALGLVELGIPLGVVAALFAMFVGLQARYFFGGDAVVLSTAGLGWGDYARRGFLELVAVTGLMVPLLLAADGVADRDDSRTVRGVRTLSVVLLGLVALIAASAVYRLWLYYGVYGLTPTRVYAAALMAWICLVLAWLAATVLRGRPDAFPLGAVISGLGVLACLNVANPEGMVARVNLERARAGAELDVELLAGLSADAAPELSRVPCELAGTLQHPIGRSGSPGWRSWNASRSRADRLWAQAATRCRSVLSVALGRPVSVPPLPRRTFVPAPARSTVPPRR
jgi:hypothetical protein